MLGILVLLFTLVPAIEFYLLYEIGSQIGAGNTFAIIIFTGVIGAYLAKSQGPSILMQVQSELGRGAVPGKQIAHGFLVFGGGLLLLTPGFITDILGFCMVIPGTRHMIIELLTLYFKHAIAKGTIRFMNSGNTQFYKYRSDNRSQHTGPHQVDENTFEADFKEKK